MKREIKFRVLKDGQMVYSDDHKWNMPYEFFEQACLDFDDAMMYTGFKDSSGKEIYEGDRVEWIVQYQEYDFDKDDWYQKYPKPGKIVYDVKRGVVVFDEITGVDDFYCPAIVGWGIKEEGEFKSVISLLEEIRSLGVLSFRVEYKELFKSFLVIE